METGILYSSILFGVTILYPTEGILPLNYVIIYSNLQRARIVIVPLNISVSRSRRLLAPLETA